MGPGKAGKIPKLGSYSDKTKISPIYIVRGMLDFRFRLAKELMGERGEGILQPVLNMKLP